jgi:hypothetical protein
VRFDAVGEVKFELVFEVEGADLLLQVVEEVEALGELDVTIQGLG